MIRAPGPGVGGEATRISTLISREQARAENDQDYASFIGINRGNYGF